MCIGSAEPAGKTQPPNSQFLGPVGSCDDFLRNLYILYNDFDLVIEKMEIPDLEMDAKLNSKTHIFFLFLAFRRVNMGIKKRRI
jgi:hypothetical protein